MNRTEILEALKMLARSQGSYGRLLRTLNEMPKSDYDAALDELEAQNFGSVVDMVMWLEG